jgi:penicillin-binding protein-related factor A (putative recombinase)
MELVHAPSRANRGRWYQRLVTAACRLYDAQERAYIAEIPTPMGIAKGGEAAFFKAKAITDYFSTLKGGRSVAFDAKGSLDDVYRAGIPDHQLRVMERVHRLGGISGVLIGFPVEETIRSWWVPWPSANAIASGEWTPERIAALPGAVSARFVGYIDFLPALETAT